MIKYLASQTHTTAVISKWYPVVATIQLLHKRRSQRTMATRGHHESMLQSPLHALVQSLEEQEAFWLQYWVVHAALQSSKRLIVLEPQLELLFYVAFHGVPLFLPQGQLLSHFTNRLTSTALFMHDRLSSTISQDTWQHVVEKAKSLCNTMVFLQLLKQSSADYISHFVEEGRSFVIPGITLFMPGFFTLYGVSYVQYILPLAKSAAQPATSKVQPLQYWALHTLAAALLHSLPGFIQWIPFSTHAFFIFWCWLSLPQTIEVWYSDLEEDLQAFGVLPANPNRKVKPVQETRIVRVLQWLLEQLPRAAEANEKEPAPAKEGQRVEPNTDENAANIAELDDAMEDIPDLDDEDWVVEEEDEVMAPVTTSEAP